jgi:hypothetical protein
LRSVGFHDVEITPVRTYGAEQGRALLARLGHPEPPWLAEFDGAFASAFVRARKSLQAKSCNAASATQRLP